MKEVAVVGGGVIGLSVAWRLRQLGMQVRVFDAAPEAREASWAAGGMLAPHHEAAADGPLWRFGCAALQRWPSFLAELGVAAAAVDYRAGGGLVPEIDAQDAAELAAKEEFLSAAGISCQRWSRVQLRVAEPALQTARSALWLPAAQVDPRRLLRALRAACEQAGVSLHYACPVERLLPGELHSAEVSYAVDAVVIASGAWTSALAKLAGIELPGEPVKGQMLRLQAADGLLGRFVHCRHTYCIPRRGRGIVVGASQVCSGFDKAEDPAAIEQLAAGARRLLPALAKAQVLESWTGLRPRLLGGLPCIDRLDPQLLICTGHFRNGILLAPVSADRVAELLTGASSAGPALSLPHASPHP